MMSTEPQMESAPSRGVPFGRYLIKMRLGRGGMGEVFLAEQLGPLGPVRPVALKRMLPQIANDRSVVRLFLEEMGTAALLNHPNIATTYDFGEVDGVYFMAMEYVEGLPLNEIIAKLGPLPIPETLAIVRAVLDALAYAHALKRPGGNVAPVVHSDVSPHNVMISSEGAVKLLDFGLARAEAAALGAGPVRGKIAYVAPEQAQGSATDRRFDLWAVGVTLYEAVAGRRPFEGESLQQVFDAARLRAYRPIAELRAGAEVLEAIVARALEPDPALRWESAPAFAQACGEAAKRFGTVSKERLAALVARTGGAPRRTEEDREVTATGVAAIDLRGFTLPDDDPTLPPATKRTKPRTTTTAKRVAIGAAVTALIGSLIGYVKAKSELDEVVIVEPARTASTSDEAAGVLGRRIREATSIERGAEEGAAEDPRSADARVEGATGDPRDAKGREAEGTAGSRHGDRQAVKAREARDTSRSRPGDPRAAKAQGNRDRAGSRERDARDAKSRDAREKSDSAGSREAEARDAKSRDAREKSDSAGSREAEARDGKSRDARDNGDSAGSREAEARDAKAREARENRDSAGSREAEAREAKSRETQARGLGVLSVKTVPWARVTLDGKSLGEGIVAGKPVPAGKHTLLLTPGDDSYPARTVEIEIRVGVPTKVFVDFPAGTVRIDPS